MSECLGNSVSLKLNLQKRAYNETLYEIDLCLLLLLLFFSPELKHTRVIKSVSLLVIILI